MKKWPTRTSLKLDGGSFSLIRNFPKKFSPEVWAEVSWKFRELSRRSKRYDSYHMSLNSILMQDESCSMTHATSFRHLSVVHYDGLSILTLKNDQKRLKLLYKKSTRQLLSFRVSSSNFQKNIVMVSSIFLHVNMEVIKLVSQIIQYSFYNFWF